jgi:membrane protein implicated in regulation of membrane protease activity
VFVLALVLVLVALLLLLAEAHLSTGGLVGAGAAIALVSGLALLLIGAGAGVLAVLAVSAAVGAAAVGGLVLLGRSVRSTRVLRPRSGTAVMVGHLGEVRVSDSAARVFVDGALWRAHPSPLEEELVLHDGDRVVVEHVNGMTLYVRKAEELELNR